MTAADAGGQEPMIFGVPGTQLVTALRNAGLNDDAVVAMVGRAIAQSAGVLAADTQPGFVFTTEVAETAPERRRRTRLRTVTFIPQAQTPARMGPDRSQLSSRANSCHRDRPPSTCWRLVEEATLTTAPDSRSRTRLATVTTMPEA